MFHKGGHCGIQSYIWPITLFLVDLTDLTCSQLEQNYHLPFQPIQQLLTLRSPRQPVWLSLFQIYPLASVFKSSEVQFFSLKMRQLATATGLDRFRYSGTATGPLKTSPNRSTTWKKPVQTGCDWFFVVKFTVPNKTNITSRKLHIWIDILIPCRLVKVSSNFVKIWLRYGENGRDIHLSCV